MRGWRMGQKRPWNKHVWRWLLSRAWQGQSSVMSQLLTTSICHFPVFLVLFYPHSQQKESIMLWCCHNKKIQGGFNSPKRDGSCYKSGLEYLIKLLNQKNKHKQTNKQKTSWIIIIFISIVLFMVSFQQQTFTDLDPSLSPSHTQILLNDWIQTMIPNCWLRKNRQANEQMTKLRLIRKTKQSQNRFALLTEHERSRAT